MRQLRCLEKPGAKHPVQQCHVPGKLLPQCYFTFPLNTKFYVTFRPCTAEFITGYGIVTVIFGQKTSYISIDSLQSKFVFWQVLESFQIRKRQRK